MDDSTEKLELPPVIFVCKPIANRFEVLCSIINNNKDVFNIPYDYFALKYIWDECSREILKKFNLPEIELLGDGFSKNIPQEILSKLPVSIKSIDWYFAKTFELKSNQVLDEFEKKIESDINEKDISFLRDLTQSQLILIIKEIFEELKDEHVSLGKWLVKNFGHILAGGNDLNKILEKQSKIETI